MTLSNRPYQCCPSGHYSVSFILTFILAISPINVAVGGRFSPSLFLILFLSLALMLLLLLLLFHSHHTDKNPFTGLLISTWISSSFHCAFPSGLITDSFSLSLIFFFFFFFNSYNCFFCLLTEHIHKHGTNHFQQSVNNQTISIWIKIKIK